jgi:hypothetical protein
MPRLEVLEDRMAPATDIQLEAFTGAGKGNVAVTYQIVGEDAPEFTLGFFRSADDQWNGDETPLGAFTISDAADLSVGAHTKVFALGAGAGQLPLPGAGAADVFTDYFLLAVADPSDEVAEDDADPHNEDNTAAFEGAYQLPRGPVMVHGGPGDDVIRLASGNKDLIINGKLIKYRDDRVLEYRVHAHAGNDQVRGPALKKRLKAWGGDGNDVLIGGRLNDRLDGGAGDDVLNGKAGNDVAMTSTGRDVLRLAQGKDTVNTAALLEAAEALAQVSIQFQATLRMTGNVDGCSGSGNVTLNGNAAINADGTLAGTFSVKGSASYSCSDGCFGNANGSGSGTLSGTAASLSLKGSVQATVKETCPDGSDTSSLKLKFEAKGTIVKDRLSIKLTGKNTGISGAGEYKQFVTVVS